MFTRLLAAVLDGPVAYGPFFPFLRPHTGDPRLNGYGNVSGSFRTLPHRAISTVS